LILPCLVFLLSFLLRLSFISKGPYHLDCLNLAIVSEKTLITHTLYHLYGVGYPLVVLLGSLFIFLMKTISIPDPVFSVNLMSAVFSSLAVVTFYAMVKRLLDPWSAILSSIILSVLPSFLSVSVYGTSHTPSLFFLFLGLFFLLKHKESGLKRDLLWAGLGFGFMGGCRLQDLILMIVPASFLWERAHRQPVRSFFMFWSLAFLVSGAFYLPFLSGKSAPSYQIEFYEFWRTGLLSNFRGFLSPSLGNTMAIMVLNFFPVGFMLAAGGFFLLGRQAPKTFLFLILWFVVPTLFYGNLYSTVSRFLVFSMVPLTIGLGYMLSWLLRSPYKIMSYSSLFFFFLTIYLMTNSIHPLLAFRHHYALLPQFAQWIEKNTEKNAQIIVGDEGLFIEYYAHRGILGRPRMTPSVPFLNESSLNGFKNTLDSLLDQEIPVYIDSDGLYSYDPGQRFSRLIKENYFLIFKGRHLSEDWHRGELDWGVYWQSLYKIQKRPTPSD